MNNLCDVDFSYIAVLGWFIWKVLPLKAHKRCINVTWNRRLLLQKPQLHLYRSQIIDPKPNGRQPLLAFAPLVCSYCPVCKKIKLHSLTYIHHLTFLARVGSVRRVCGELEEFFWSSAYSVLKRHQEKLHWFFFSSFFPLLASPKFLYRELAGGPPCRCCFNSATQNGVGQNRLLQWRGEGERNKPKKFTATFLRCFQSRTTLSEFGLFFHKGLASIFVYFCK